jgi:glycosyltransferase involved in cell wall biosynthesis
MDGVPWGGSEELWFRTAELALKSGHQVQTITRYWATPPPKIDELKRLGAKIDFYSKPNSIFYRKILSKLLAEKEELPEIEGDVIVLSNGGTTDFVYKQGMCRQIIESKKPYTIISQHNFETGHILDQEKRLFAQKFIGTAQSFFFVSQRNLEICQRQLAYTIPNSFIISNPVNISTPRITKYPQHAELRMACVARLDCNFKGQDILIQALAGVEWENKNFVLNLYGSGPDRLYLEDLINYYHLNKKIFVKGHIDRVETIWEDSQVILLPSLSEGTPLSLMEAMLSGRSALSTDVGDVSKYIIDKSTGFLCQPGSVTELRRCLNDLWNKKDHLEEMGKNAYYHAVAITDLTPANTLLKYLQDIA